MTLLLFPSFNLPTLPYSPHLKSFDHHAMNPSLPELIRSLTNLPYSTLDNAVCVELAPKHAVNLPTPLRMTNTPKRTTTPGEATTHHHHHTSSFIASR